MYIYIIYIYIYIYIYKQNSLEVFISLDSVKLLVTI